MKGIVMDLPNAADPTVMSTEEVNTRSLKLIRKIVVRRIVVPIVIASAVVIAVNVIEKHLDKKDNQNNPE